MKVTMLLCDAAQVADGKLFVLGGGWSITGPEPAPSAIAIKLDVDWHEAATPHHWTLSLVDADGHDVLVETPDGHQSVGVEGDFEVGRPEGVPAGTPVDLPLALSLGPLPLQPDSRYVWRFSVDGHSEAAWSLSFTTRPAS